MEVDLWVQAMGLENPILLALVSTGHRGASLLLPVRK